MKKRLKRIFAELVLGLIFFIYLLVGCTDGPTLPTPIDYTPPSPTSTICPTIYFPTPNSLSKLPLFIVFLAEDVNDRGDWKYTSVSYEIISNVLSSVSEPGDSIVVFRMGPLEFKDALLLDASAGSAYRPDIPITLTPWPSLTPINTLTGSSGFPLYDMMTATRGAETQIVANATSTQISVLNGCGRQIWVSEYSAVATQWEATRQESKKRFSGIINEGLHTPTQVGTPTPVGTPMKGGSNSVFEGLNHATLAFSAKCDTGKYRHCVLIIFSDLSEYRPSSPSYFNTPTNLKNVDVMSVLLNYRVSYDPDYIKTKEKWTDIFSSLGAKSSKFIVGDDNVETELINFIRR